MEFAWSTAVAHASGSGPAAALKAARISRVQAGWGSPGSLADFRTAEQLPGCRRHRQVHNWHRPRRHRGL